MTLTLLGLLYAAILILMTNAATVRGRLRRNLRLLQAAMPAAIAVQYLSIVSASSARELHHLLYLTLTPAAIVAMLLLIGFETPWRLVERIVKAAGLGASRSFDSRCPPHRLALLFMLCALAALFGTASAVGARQALLAAYATTQGALLNLGASATVYILLAFLGVGWLTRRDWKASCARLGLRLPTRMDWLAGGALGCLLYLGSALLTLVWQNTLPASAFEWQTALPRQIFDAFSASLFLAAVVALSSAIGEEILFRGALQPVFGVLIVSLFFTALHLQYAFTPAAAIVYLVSLALGFLRAWLSASATIIAHFVYNMIPFFLASMA